MATEETGSVLAQLMDIIEDRRKNPPEQSYTTTLFAGGVPKIGEKILEEAAEGQVLRAVVDQRDGV